MNATPLTHTCPVAQFRDSNDANQDHRVSSNTFDLIAAGRRGSARVTAKVNGYWSSDVITLYIDRKGHYDNSDASSWAVTMSHSSGGRLTTLSDHYPSPHYVAVASDLDAEMNFGEALISLSHFGREILQYTDVMEEAYQAQRQFDDAKYEAEKVAKQALIDADAPLGVPAAKKLVAEARAAVLPYQTVGIHLYTRGSDIVGELYVKKTARMTWYWGGVMMGEDAVIAKLAEMSCRTCAA